jgi:hypothetical protein
MEGPEEAAERKLAAKLAEAKLFKVSLDFSQTEEEYRAFVPRDNTQEGQGEPEP